MTRLNNYGQPMKACDMRQCCRGICYLFEVGEQEQECFFWHEGEDQE